MYNKLINEWLKNVYKCMATTTARNKIKMSNYEFDTQFEHIFSVWLNRFFDEETVIKWCIL